MIICVVFKKGEGVRSGRRERRGEYMRHKTKDKACGKDQPSRQGQLEKKERGRVKV